MDRHFSHGEVPDITAEACAWVAQFETGEMTAADREAFGEWILRSPRHAAEIRRLAALSRELNMLTDMAQPIRKAARQRGSAIPPAGRKARFSIPRLAACAVVVIAVVAATLLRPAWNRPVDEPMVAATAVGEQQNINLPDGTVVTLNTDSQLEVTYNRSERKVRLLRGEAFFNVAHNHRWPFVVYVGDNTVRAVGTAFTVSLVGQQTEVAVTEGRVELAEVAKLPLDVASKPAPKADRSGKASIAGAFKPVALDAGQSITVLPGIQPGSVVTKPRRETERELAWLSGLLEFSDTPLSEVVAQINRYSTLTVEINDPALAKLKFGGIFRIDDTEPLLDALQTSYHIRVERIGEHRISLTRAETENPRANRKKSG
ncbi:MAG: FecR domain-containing protein [Anaerolineae bacterium]|nr:FecR domain-containing protein [Anaerolineae bacterium]